MRTVLSILAGVMLAGSALAAEPFTPPKLHVITKPGVTDISIVTAAYAKANEVCLAAEADPDDRERYYIRCMKDELGKDGFTVLTQKEYDAMKPAEDKPAGSV